MSIGPRMALVVGLLVGLVTSGVVVGVGQRSAATSAPILRPAELPAEATWHADVFGYPRWIACVPADEGVTCTAYAASGELVLTASYVPVGDAAPAPPFAHIVARKVERIWLNKVAMVPDGPVQVAGGPALEYVRGELQAEPANL